MTATCATNTIIESMLIPFGLYCQGFSYDNIDEIVNTVLTTVLHIWYILARIWKLEDKNEVSVRIQGV